MEEAERVKHPPKVTFEDQHGRVSFDRYPFNFIDAHGNGVLMPKLRGGTGTVGKLALFEGRNGRVRGLASLCFAS